MSNRGDIEFPACQRSPHPGRVVTETSKARIELVSAPRVGEVKPYFEQASSDIAVKVDGALAATGEGGQFLGGLRVRGRELRRIFQQLTPDLRLLRR